MEIIKGRKSKLCTKCQQYRPITQFGVNRRNADGLHNTCKQCVNKKDDKDYIIRLIRRLNKGSLDLAKSFIEDLYLEQEKENAVHN